MTDRLEDYGLLRDGDEPFRLTCERAPVGVAHLGTDGQFLWVNDKLCEMTGYDAEELASLTIGALTHTADRPAGDQARREMLAGVRSELSVVRRLNHKSGGVCWANLFTTLLRSRVGEPRHFVTVVIDITETKRSEHALALRDRAMQQLAEGILITDPRQADNPIIYASAGLTRMTGHTQEEVLGRNCRFLQGEATDPETVATLRDAIREGRAANVEILNYRKDGTPFWNGLSLTPVHDAHGALELFVGVQSDVTSRRALQDQLRQAHKMEAVGRLAGGVAHDFNNLLTVIAGYSSLLLSGPGISDDDREAFEAIREAGERGAALTRQLLGFSRKAMLQPKVIDLNTLITDMEKMLHRLIGEDVHLTTVLHPGLSRVRADPAQLDQVLMNLAVNARDAMPQGGTLTIETANVLVDAGHEAWPHVRKRGGYVKLAMTDTGCGMTPDVSGRIFEPFFTTKGIDQGTGLGLSTVFGIVQQSEGCVCVHSAPGRGTTFTVYVPAVAEPLTATGEVSPDAKLRGCETILIVEDDASVRALASTSLRQFGYTVLTATDGRHALALIGDHVGSIDLVLTDVVMPKLSGGGLAKVLKSRFPRLKVLFMSGYTDDAVLRHGMRDDGVDLIQKPYTPVSLAQKVRQVLDEAATGA